MLTAIHLFFGRAPLPVILLSSLVMGVVVSWLAYRLVEEPSIRLGRWLTRAKSLAPGDAVKYAPDQVNDRTYARIERP
jgi:peptidoglycan/LPS O-acetylase OafA/YrhL